MDLDPDSGSATLPPTDEEVGQMFVPHNRLVILAETVTVNIATAYEGRILGRNSGKSLKSFPP